MSEMPQAGDPAPDFVGPTQGGESVRLGDALEKDGTRAVLVYFYPKDDTPGCTKQACNLQDHLGTLEESGVQVIGVSPDDEESHERFADKHNLHFPLVADPEHTILNQYGVWGERNLYGRKFMGVKRTSFLVGQEGTILHVFKRPKTSAHAEEVLAKLAQLESARRG